MLTVTLILAGVGIGVNVAQAVASAVAQALQSGVEITAQDMWQAVLNRRSGRSRKTVVLEGDEARKVLREGIGASVSLDDEQRHDTYVASDTDIYADGDFGREGRVASVDTVLESDDGDVLVAVEVEQNDPIEALADGAESEARKKLDGLFSEQGTAAAGEPVGGAADTEGSDTGRKRLESQNDARKRLNQWLGDGVMSPEALVPPLDSATTDQAQRPADPIMQTPIGAPLVGPDGAGPGTELPKPDGIDGLEQQAAEEAGRKLDELLGGRASGRGPGDGGPANTSRHDAVSVKKDEKKPLIPSVPATLSDDRELSRAWQSGDGAASSAAEPSAGGDKALTQSHVETASAEASNGSGAEGTVPTEVPPTDKSGRAPIAETVFGDGLEVDAQGRVKYGEQWLPRDEALKKINMDREWRTAKAEGQEKVDRFRLTVEQLDNTTDPETRGRLQESLVRQASELNSDYAAKTCSNRRGRAGPMRRLIGRSTVCTAVLTNGRRKT